MLKQAEIVLSESEIKRRVDEMAAKMSSHLKEDCIGVCLLTGGLWYAADLMRSLSKHGHNLAFDALWLSSYGDGRMSGELILRADLQRPVLGRQVLIMDDVLDTGASLKFAKDHLLRAGASQVLIAVMARKPVDGRAIEADFVGWEAPNRYLVGYGLDRSGNDRGLPYIGAVD